MKNISVNTFIHILFTMVITILISAFMLFLSWHEDRAKIEEYKRYQLLTLTFISELKLIPTQEKLHELYRKLSLLEVQKDDKKLIKKHIETYGETIFSGDSQYGLLRVFKIEDVQYIYVQRMGYNLLLVDNKQEEHYLEYAASIWLFVIFIFLLLYLAVLKKLKPLKRLHREIEKFAKGDMTIRVSYFCDDEIGKIAKSFNRAIEHINELSASKNLFMRNLMHELKTPITKGRIVVEMLEDESSKKILIRSFNRMNELITELAEIERVTAHTFDPYLEEATLEVILDRSKKLLINDSKKIEIDVSNDTIVTDIQLLSLALKNLLDNGIKYSVDNRVCIYSYGDNIRVISKGEKLKHPLSYYLEPFSQEEKRSQGFGLGLYIVNSILEKLQHKFSYRYEDGRNIFIIDCHPKEVEIGDTTLIL